MKGFFSPTVWTAQRRPLSLVSDCGSCGLYKDCQSPKMKVAGEGLRKVLIVAECPGRMEDIKGEPLVGDAGFELSNMLNSFGVNMRRDCWLYNAVICRPHAGERNRNPTNDENDYCRPNLRNLIQELKPEVIIPLGYHGIRSVISIAWKENEADDAGTWVGWRIPCNKLNTWICPTYHPSYILRTKNQAVRLHVRKHLKAAFELKGRPWQEVPDWTKYVNIVIEPSLVVQALDWFIAQGKPIAFDYETTTLKPDGPHAKLLCCAVSNVENTISFPCQGAIVPALKKLLTSNLPKIAANLRFELRWTRKVLGVNVNNWLWDTMLAAHWLDCRHGICSLKFQAFVQFGADDYDSHLDAFKGRDDKDSNLPNRLHEVEPMKLLMYCGLDALFEAMLAQQQIGA